MQDTVLRLWKLQEKNKGKVPDLPLAFSTLRFCAMDRHRADARRRKREDAVVYLNSIDRVGDPPFELADDENEEAAQLRQAVGELPGKLREVITMKIWGGLTFAQISEVLAISPNTAASRYRYALEHLEKAVRHNDKIHYGNV